VTGTPAFTPRRLHFGGGAEATTLAEIEAAAVALGERLPRLTRSM